MARNIVLIGMPASGKSSVGKVLAKKTGFDFVDTDALIESRENRKISDIFAEEGEPYFRNLEVEVTKELSEKENQIISTGGGLVMNPLNVENLRKNGMLIFLDRDVTHLIPTADRPLGDTTEKMQNLYKERFPVYKKAADRTVKVHGTIEETAEDVWEALNEVE